LDSLQGDINISVLRKSNLIPKNANKVKIFKSGDCERSINLFGISVSKSVKEAIEKKGGTVS
jgi:large subunit ribosomal protein L15